MEKFNNFAASIMPKIDNSRECHCPDHPRNRGAAVHLLRQAQPFTDRIDAGCRQQALRRLPSKATDEVRQRQNDGGCKDIRYRIENALQHLLGRCRKRFNTKRVQGGNRHGDYQKRRQEFRASLTGQRLPFPICSKYQRPKPLTTALRLLF